MLKGFFLLCAAAGLQAAPALAEPAAATSATQPAPAHVAEPRICRSEQVLGTRLGRARACHTAAEWTELHRQEQANISHIQNARMWNSEACPNSLKPGC